MAAAASKIKLNIEINIRLLLIGNSLLFMLESRKVNCLLTNINIYCIDFSVNLCYNPQRLMSFYEINSRRLCMLK